MDKDSKGQRKIIRWRTLAEGYFLQWKDTLF